MTDREVPVLSADQPELQQGLQPPPPAMPPSEVEAALNDIEDAAISYDAEELPRLEFYLLDPDPEIRKAALDGMMTLGDAAASPLLRKAAEDAYSPQEAVAMLEAADYLELPSGTLSPLEKSAAETRLLKIPSVKPMQFEKFFMRDKAPAPAQSSVEPTPSP